jgi:peptidoglycan-associated lipoprotein
MKKQGLALPVRLFSLLQVTDQTFRLKQVRGGDFKFALKADVDYIFLASKRGYLNGKEKETTKGQDKSREFMVTILLTPIDRPIELPNILYDFDKWDLRPESMVSLDKLVETLNDNPNVTIEIMSHTDPGIQRNITLFSHRKEHSQLLIIW